MEEIKEKIRSSIEKSWWVFGVVLAVLWWLVSVSVPLNEILFNSLFYLYLGTSLILSWLVKTYLIKNDGSLFVPTRLDMKIGLAWTLTFIIWIEMRGHTHSRVQNIVWLPFAIWDIIFEKLFHPDADAFIVLFIPFLLLGGITSVYLISIARMIIKKVWGRRN